MINKEKYPILAQLDGVESFRALPGEKMTALAIELREYIVETVKANGGHLASNLGVVELTMALHKVFDSPNDKLIFDVGHQAYAHKILTSRRDAFETLRLPGGLSGFTRRDESVHDPFGAGHASTSISAAVGFAESARLSGRKDFAIAVIGDGSMTGGLAYEALNNISKDSRLIIVLNDNEMSISASTGSFSNYLSKIRSKPGYHNTKRATRSILQKIPLIGNAIFKCARAVKKAFKNLFYRSNYFEDMGLYYLGPCDGHDYRSLKTLLEAAKEYARPCVVHVKTTKGKGYSPAEISPDVYHGIAPDSAPLPDENFSAIMGQSLCALAEKDRDICAVTAAMKDGTGLSCFAEKYPERFFDVGIAEEHALVFSAALAADNKKPVFAVYSSFLQRGYDNIIHDIALQQLPVTVCVDRASLSGADGATHNGIFDVAMLTPLKNVALYAPVTNESLVSALEVSLSSDRPSFIRYPNCAPLSLGSMECDKDYFYSSFASAELCDSFIVTYGRLVKEALTAAKALEGFGVKCGVILLEKLLPLNCPISFLESKLEGAKEGTPLLFAEEGVKEGGLSSSLLCAVNDSESENLKKLDITVKAIENPFEKCAKGQNILSSFALSGADLAAVILHKLKKI